MASTITSCAAMFNVLESWGVKRMYGFPGGYVHSLTETMEKQPGIRYIQMRSEESGAMAAAAEAKLSGRPAVCFAAIGEGHRLLSSLREARAFGGSLLVLVVGPPSAALNSGAFREMHEGAMFSGLYTQMAVSPEKLPRMADEVLRRAMKEKGPMMMMASDDCLRAEIEKRDFSSATTYRHGTPVLDEAELAAAARLIEASSRPILFAGQGAREAGSELLSLADHFSLPIVISGQAKGLIADDEENCLGASARLGTKPANEALAAADLIILAGSDFPDAGRFFARTAKCVQIDIDPAKLGRRRKVEAAILGDAGEAMLRLIKIGRRKSLTKFLEASRLNMKNWREWLEKFARPDEALLRTEAVFGEINRVAAGEAIFAVEPGNTLIHAIRLLKMNGRGQRFLCPGSLSSTGFAIPAGIAAKALYPERQVFTLSGDGAAARSMGDIATQVKYGLPVINLVFSNNALGFLETDANSHFGLDLPAIDFAKAAEAMGARAFTVTDQGSLRQALGEAGKADGPTLVNLKIANDAPFPSHKMILDETRHGADAVRAFRTKYALGDMPTLEQIFRGLPKE